MPLHPDLAAFLEMANANPTKMHQQPVADARDSYDMSSQLLGEVYDDMLPEFTVKTKDGHNLTVREYTSSEMSKSLANTVIIFFHGGGYVLGSLASHDTLCREIAKHCGCKLFAVDYRRAPEHKFPTAFNDACDAYDAILRLQSEETHVILIGDSVGATLALNVSINARDKIHRKPLKQILLYPCTSSNQDTHSHHEFSEGYLLESDNLQWMFNHYLNDHDERLDWRFAPLQHANLSNLPQTHVILAEYDVLVDEGKLLVEKLKQESTPVTLDIFEGMVHDFARFGNIVPESVDKLYKVIANYLAD